MIPQSFPYRLGKKRVMHDPRTLKLTNYLRQLPPPPERFDGTEGITDWRMYANDRLGDCTCAAAGHMEMVWSKASGGEVLFTDDQIVDLYNRVNGGQDDGAVELFVLREWRNNGLAGYKLHAYAACEQSDLELVRQASSLFLGLYIGVALPVSAQSQDVWDDTRLNDPRSQPGSWGGHAVPIVGFDPETLGFVTWAGYKRMTWAFWNRYVEEAWACLPEDFSASAIDFRKLDEDLAQVSSINP